MAAQSQTPLKPFLLASILSPPPTLTSRHFPSDSRDGTHSNSSMRKFGAAIFSRREAATPGIQSPPRHLSGFQISIQPILNHPVTLLLNPEDITHPISNYPPI